MNIYVLRNNQQFGPYDETVLLQYVNQGQILAQDQAIEEGHNEIETVGFFLKKNGLTAKVESRGNIIFQLKQIGPELIFPRKELFSIGALSDQRSIILMLVGLLPMFFVIIHLRGFILFYVVALYFSIIWGLFFYACFKTPQVKLKTTILVFFLCQLCVFVVWNLMNLPRINPFYSLIDKSFPINTLGYVFGVGLSEELGKMIPLLVILRKAREPLIPQTMVFYGLISGIAFGINEGVQYQMTINAEQEYEVSFFLNIARLTGLPFLHACWCGIAGYFLSFAQLYPKYRHSLYLLSLAIPAVIHGLYDSLLSPLSVFLGLMLLITYLKKGVNYQSKLRN